MKKTSGLFAITLGVACLTGGAETLPLPIPVWKSYGKAEVRAGAETVTVRATAKMGGVAATIRLTPERRYTIRCEMAGEGKVQLSVSGTTGWVYGPSLTLNEDFQKCELSFFESRQSVTVACYSLSGTPISFKVQKFTITPEALPELTADTIDAKLFPAAEYPGSNGKMQPKNGARDGRAMWGKRWYVPVRIPVPLNRNPLYVYVHLIQDSDAPMKIYLLRGPQTISPVATFRAKEQWSWIKLGPISAVGAYPELGLSYGGDAATQLWVDKLVMSTNAALDDAALDKVE